jgi:hypothetical protein
VRAYAGQGNVLVCWEHGVLAQIADALGVKGFAASSGWGGGQGGVKYPGERFDLIWMVPEPYDQIAAVESEGVPTLDKGLTGAP